MSLLPAQRPQRRPAQRSVQKKWRALTLLLTPLAAAGADGDAAIEGKVFTYTELDVAALTEARAERPRNRSDLPISVPGRKDEDPSFIFFSTGNDCQDTDIFPVIAVFREGEWNTVAFQGGPFRNHFWSHVYPFYSDDRKFYAVSESNCAGGGPEVLIYRSMDGGRSWYVSLIPKHYMSHFLTLRIAADGSGEVIVQSYNDADPVGGHHVYRTYDWGHSWSDPEFSPTLLTPPTTPGFYRSEYVPIVTLMQGVADAYERRRAE